jgi:CubicO group peptidase (beta-lactamase class C family)
LGFGLVTDVAASGVMGSQGEYSWGGAAGTIFWVDPVEDFVMVAMIQLMGSPWSLRSDLKIAVNQAIVGE